MFSPKYIGLCQKRAVGVNCEGKKVMLTIKSTKNDTKPCKMAHDSRVKCAKSIAKEVIVLGIVELRVGHQGQLPSLP